MQQLIQQHISCSPDSIALKNWTAGEPDEVGNIGNMENEVGRGRKRGNKTCGENQE